MTADELVRLAASGTQGWVSTDHVTWVLRQLNDMQNDTMLLCPNVVVNIHNEMTRKAKLFNLGTLKRLVFALNVGQRNGKTFIGSPQNGGNHWVLVDVELRPFMKIIYCDTLAWQPPPDIIGVVNDFARYIPQVGTYKKSHLVLAPLPVRLIGRVMNVTGDVVTIPCRVALIYVVLLLW